MLVMITPYPFSKIIWHCAALLRVAIFPDFHLNIRSLLPSPNAGVLYLFYYCRLPMTPHHHYQSY